VRCFLIAAKSDMYNNDVGKGGKRGEYMLMKLMKKKKIARCLHGTDIVFLHVYTTSTLVYLLYHATMEL
jgi:hypothetical protein